MPGDDAKRPFRVYRGRGGQTEDPIEERARASAAGAPPAPPAEPPVTPPPIPRATPPRGRPGVVVLPDEQPPGPRRDAPGRPTRTPGRRPSVWRMIAIAVVGVALVLLLWVGYGYWQFRGSMDAANKRVDSATRAALTPAGSPLSTASTTLVLGSDVRPGGGGGRSDSIMLVRVDPDSNRIAQLSIPRDLRVTIPGHGDDRINVAYTLGGPALAIKTVQDLTGIPINHVVLVDFAGFRELVDALGGVTIDNPTKIISNSFDGHPWRFGRGRLHLDGRHALAYARVRENTADPSDNDLTRGLRQQRVLQAIAHSLASPGTIFRLPSVGRTIGKPLTTDLSADNLLALGWRQMRASSTLHCRLGGTTTSVGGASELIGGDENRRVILAVLGKSAPVAATPGDTFAAGCT